MLIALVVIVAVVLVVVALAMRRPATFRVERHVTIDAPRARVFALVDDFRRWREWSPWEDKDPAMRRTLGGAEQGLGAVYEWDGNRQVGAGRMEIVESLPPARLAVKLDFLRPFEAHNVAGFTFEEAGGGTRVTWALGGPSPFASRLIGVFVSMDRMVGPDFEKGLARLKTLAEQG